MAILRNIWELHSGYISYSRHDRDGGVPQIGLGPWPEVQSPQYIRLSPSLVIKYSHWSRLTVPPGPAFLRLTVILHRSLYTRPPAATPGSNLTTFYFHIFQKDSYHQIHLPLLWIFFPQHFTQYTQLVYICVCSHVFFYFPQVNAWHYSLHEICGTVRQIQ